MAINKKDVIELLVEARVNLSDAKALKFKAMYPDWKVGIDIKQKDIDECRNRYVYDDKLYKCKTAHTTADHWKPGIDTASLWEVIDEQHEGTKEDPIPYDTNMTVYKDKYYIYNDVVYLCIRDSGQPLYSEPAPLVGNYFEVA
jgi:hypothetical protein